jgi:hypothetical protein
MASPTGPAHLSGHHRDTVRKIMQHPTSHNIEWHDVLSLLRAIGTLEQHRDNKVEVQVGSQTAFLDMPAHKDVEAETVVALRHLLGGAGYGGD